MPHPVDVNTEFGEARQVHILAAKRIFDDMVKRSIERQVLASRAKRIEALSPAAGSLLRTWIQNWNDSCKHLAPEDIPDTDSDY